MEHASLQALALRLRDPVREERSAPIGTGRALSEVLGLRQRHRVLGPGTRPPWHPLLFGEFWLGVSRLAAQTHLRSHYNHSSFPLNSTPARPLRARQERRPGGVA